QAVGGFFLNRFEILPIVPKPPSLSNRRFVVDINNSGYEFIIERHGANDNASLPRLLDILPDISRGLFPQPLGVGGYGNGSSVVPFEVVVMFWCGIWNALGKGENVGSYRCSAEFLNKFCRILNQLALQGVLLVD